MKDAIFDITGKKAFEKLALKVFRYQFQHVPAYKQFCSFLKVEMSDVKSIVDIPFLPVEFFKSHRILPEGEDASVKFTSSGTTGAITSTHHVVDIGLYENSFRRGFSQFYGNIEDYAVLALLPSYLERSGSSLVYMFADLIESSNNSHSGFYLNDYTALIAKLNALEAAGQQTILIGVTYALLDLIERQQFSLKNTIVMETGGMKGRRREMIREELHEILQKGFGVSTIHSEYGMTELLSQAYSMGNGLFECPPWMKIMIRDAEDPRTYIGHQKTGGINVIDLANINSCAFIATQDLGKSYENGSFEILGRFDHSDIRGCNLLVI